MLMRTASDADWPAMWPFMRRMVAAGETFSRARKTSEAEARAMWMHAPPAGPSSPSTPTTASWGRPRWAPTAVAGRPRRHGGLHGRPRPRRSVGGRALGEAVLRRARADGHRAIQFNAVAETNERAVALWRSLGFEVIGTVPEAFHPPRHGYVGAARDVAAALRRGLSASGPCRNRTYNLGIKSPLLCQLS